jgi:hypothetical protein
LDQVDLDKFNAWLPQLLTECGEQLYRLKGFLAVKGEDRKFLCQVKKVLLLLFVVVVVSVVGVLDGGMFIGGIMDGIKMTTRWACGKSVDVHHPLKLLNNIFSGS